MAHQAEVLKMNMERTEIPGTSLKVSPVAIGTWAIGGWMWGGTDEAESIATIQAAFEHGINIVDTAPVYGFGRSEEIVGRAIAESGLRSQVMIATKAGLQWEEECRAMPAAPASCGRSKIRCAGFEPITSTSIRFIGPTR
jgi:aryl-alcohol dehydrogenase-like predicted oxidoreductase